MSRPQDPHLRVWLPYAQMKTAPQPLEVARTVGSKIYLDDGRVLIDGISSWWTACHGYNHPHIVDAIAKQLDVLPHIMLGGLVHEPVQSLSRRLAAVTPGDLSYSFFSESGSVAVEVALKIAIQFWRNGGDVERVKFLSFKHAYHGDTFAAMSVCDPVEGMHAKFSGAVTEQIVAALPETETEFERFEALVTANARRLAGMIVEPLVQAAGGLKFHSPARLQRVVDVARRHDLLVIFDEIATGFGRTGSLFACEQADLVPDIMTLSKALTGGTVPLAVTIAREHVFEKFWSDDFEHALMHGPTFSGNPLGCAAANASLDLFESEPRLAQANAIGASLREQLAPCRSLTRVADVRVHGAIGVVELSDPPALDTLRTAFIDAGVWIRPFGNVVYLMPALTIAPDELERLTSAIVNVLRQA